MPNVSRRGEFHQIPLGNPYFGPILREQPSGGDFTPHEPLHLSGLKRFSVQITESLTQDTWMWFLW